MALDRPATNPVGVLSVLAARRVFGLERIPLAGPCLLVFNQLSLVDTPLLSVLVPRRDVTGLVAHDYARNPVYRFLVECGGGMWIRRGRGIGPRFGARWPRCARAGW